MNWNIKYYYTFKSINEDNYRVEILTTGTTTATEILATLTPLELEYSAKDKLDIIRSAGATLNLISSSMFQYLDLNTDHMQEFKVIIYKNGSVYWSGWLDSELYSEQLSQYDNYTVSFTASDFNILERLKYLNNNEKYTDIVSLFTVINRCLNILGLSTTINIGCSTTSTDFEIADNETIFHKLFIQSANFYDEKDEAMSLKDVIENVLKSFGMMLVQIDNEFYIYDINSIINNTTFKKYKDGVYISSGNLNKNEVDLKGLFSSDDSTLEFDTIYNNVELTSSLYANNEIFDKEVNKDDLYNLVSTTPVSGYNGYNGYQYIYSNDTGFTSDNLNYYLYTTNGSNDTLTGVKIPRTIETSGAINNEPVTGLTFQPQEYLISTQGVNKVNIKTSIYINAKINPLDIYVDAIEVAQGIKYDKSNSQCAELSCDLFMLDVNGNIISYLDNVSAQNLVWKTDIASKTKHTFRMNFASTATPLSTTDITCLNTQLTNSNIISKYEWNTFSESSYTSDNFNKGLSVNVAGGCYLKLVIYSCLISNPKAGQAAYWTDKNNILREILLQSVTIEVLDKYGDKLDTSDIVCNSYINKNVKTDYDSVDIKVCSANKSNIKIGKANLLYLNNNKYQLATSFNRSGQVSNLEQLLIRTIHSNYLTKSYKIECDIQLTDNIYINPVIYSSILNSNKFYLSGTIIDFANNSQRITLTQLSIDNIDLSNIEMTDGEGKVIDTIKTSESTRTALARTNNILDSISNSGTGSIINYSSSVSEITNINGGTW
nr:hypothetical protein [uncultured Bacteroides sp.]